MKGALFLTGLMVVGFLLSLLIARYVVAILWGV